MQNFFCVYLQEAHQCLVVPTCLVSLADPTQDKERSEYWICPDTVVSTLLVLYKT